jgi:hypothetical protein
MDERDMSGTTRLQHAYARRVAARGEAEGACVTPEAILAVVQREGPEPERLATLEHVMACAVCHREYEWLMAVDQAGLEAEGVAGKGRRTWWSGAPLALAASIVAAVGAAVVLSGVLRTGTERVRGSNSDIVLVGPGARASAGAPLAFTWQPLPGVSRYVLEVQRADGSVAYADTTADTVVTLAEPSRLLPDSAYRWWVREVTDGAEPRSSALRDVRLTGR